MIDQFGLTNLQVKYCISFTLLIFNYTSLLAYETTYFWGVKKKQNYLLLEINWFSEVLTVWVN